MMPRLLTRLLLVLLCGKLLFPTAYALAEPAKLASQITELLNRDLPPGITRSVTILTPATQLAALCTSPELSIAGTDSRLTGNRSVAVICGPRKKFIQVNVQATGQWWVARRALKPGTQIQPGDIEARSGSMARLPTGVILSKDDIIGQVITRITHVNQPFIESKLRKRWKIIAGQDVDLQTGGPGFSIRTRGKALDNAALNGSLRVKTKYGQIVTGEAIGEGKVSVYIKD